MNSFQYITVYTSPKGSNYISWKMNRYFTKDARFYVDWARSGGPWTCLNPSAPFYGCIYEDTIKRTFNMERNIYYRVRCQTRDGLEVESLPKQALGSMSKENYLRCKEIIRMWYKSPGGMHGFLLKRKEWGPVCTTCTDYDIEEVINGSCQICYGTGIVGGYYPGIDLWVESKPIAPRNRMLNPQGTGEQNPIVRTLECVSYPWISAGDIWVSGKANERYVIRQISHVAEIEGIPLFLGLGAHRLPDTSIVMDIPIEVKGEEFENEISECPSVVEELTESIPQERNDMTKSKDTTDDKGWRRGLEGENY